MKVGKLFLSSLVERRGFRPPTCDPQRSRIVLAGITSTAPETTARIAARSSSSSRNSSPGWGRLKNNHANKRHSRRSQKTATSSGVWVPVAYRGEQDDSNRGDSTRNRNRRKTYNSRNRHDNADADDERRQFLFARKEEEDRLLRFHQDLIRLAQQYRQHFQHEEKNEQAATSTTSSTSSSVIGDKKMLLSGSNQILQTQIQECLQNIHESDAPVSIEKVDETEGHFRSLCRVLQHMCSLCCSLAHLVSVNHNVDDNNSSNNNETTTDMYVDLAESLLLQVVQLEQDRALLAESTKQWGISKRGSSTNMDVDGIQGYHRPHPEGTVSGWFSKIVEDIVPAFSFASGQKNSPDTEPEQQHGETISRVVDGRGTSSSSSVDSTSHVTQRLFRNVMASIASAVKRHAVEQQQQQQGNKTTTRHTSRQADEEQRKAFGTTARRMLNLLDRMPSSWDLDLESLRYVMEILCRAGTLDSARLCKLVYERQLSNRFRLQFSLVLEAYLGAATYESDPNKLLEIAYEVLALMERQWNESLPTHRVERILHCSIVLNCFAIAGRTKEGARKMCIKGENLSRRALGGTVFEHLRREIAADQPRVDTQTLPVVNYLTQLYATSGDDGRVQVAKQMLNYMMHHDRDGVGRFMVFPHVETCNTTLLALVKRHEGKSKKERKEEAQIDFAFGKNLLNYMYGRSETGCWPDADTHDFMFRLLDAVNPDDVGNQAEELLSTIEARQFLSPANTVDINLSTYHRVMRYWLETAKNEHTSTTVDTSVHGTPCERAFRLLEKLEIRSTPVALSDAALAKTKIRNLYDLSLRPERNTYKMLLQICKFTANPEDAEKAATVAVKVMKKMVERNIAVGEDIFSLGRTCSDRLPEESRKRKEMEEFMQLIESESDMQAA